MATKKHKTIVENKIENVEQRKLVFDHYMIWTIDLGFQETIAALPVEQTMNLDVSKLYEQLMEAFYAYECHLTDYVFDRDMHNIIYSLGFVPVRSKEQKTFFLFFISLVSKWNESIDSW